MFSIHQKLIRLFPPHRRFEKTATMTTIAMVTVSARTARALVAVTTPGSGITLVPDVKGRAPAGTKNTAVWRPRRQLAVRERPRQT